MTSSLQVCFLKLQKKTNYYSAIVVSSHASSFVFLCQGFEMSTSVIYVATQMHQG